jgi:ribosomal protein S18 acetylase RimI-like enzyme
VHIRRADDGDLGALRAALLHAYNWEPTREPLPLDHPALAPYRDDWGQRGDLGVVAEEDGVVVGAAYCRLVRGYGFVDEQTPEVTIGVDVAGRGRGIGTHLLDVLADLALAHGFERLSLSVEPSNPARRLYERAGYREIGVDDGGSVLMLLDLTAAPRTA